MSVACLLHSLFIFFGTPKPLAVPSTAASLKRRGRGRTQGWNDWMHVVSIRGATPALPRNRYIASIPSFPSRANI
jgi:hypothetical protein